jgi:hypothetical protein
MYDLFDPTEGAVDGVFVSHIADDDLNLGGQPRLHLPTAMNLIEKVVEYSDGMTLTQKRLCEMASNKACAAGDQNALGHASSLSSRSGDERSWTAARSTAGANSE